MSATNEIEADIADMWGLLSKAERPKVRAILMESIRKLEAQRQALPAEQPPPPSYSAVAGQAMEVEEAAPDVVPPEAAAPAPAPAAPAQPAPVTLEAEPAPPPKPPPPPAKLPDPPAPVKLPTAPKPQGGPALEYTSIASFGWDQDSYGADPNFVYVYVTSGVDGVGEIKERVTCDFTPRSFDLKVPGLKGKNLRLLKTNLDKEIVVAESKCIVKKNQIKLKLRKAKGQYGYDNWLDLVAKRPKTDENGKTKDPGADLMDMMKDMYDNGDDAMKKTLGEAMLKSRQKEAMGGGGFDDDDHPKFGGDDFSPAAGLGLPPPINRPAHQ